MQWRYGVTQGWQRVNSRRHVAIANTAQIRTRYATRMTQGFTELGLRQRWERHAIEPFAGLAYSAARAGSFTEPGWAGLRARKTTHAAWFTTLGARLSTAWDLHRHGTLTLQAMAGWRHTLVGLTPTTTMQLPGSPRFDVNGAGLARNALLLQAGVQWQLHRHASLAFSYVGQLSQGARNHGLRANVNWRF